MFDVFKYFIFKLLRLLKTPESQRSLWAETRWAPGGAVSSEVDVLEALQ